MSLGDTVARGMGWGSGGECSLLGKGALREDTGSWGRVGAAERPRRDMMCSSTPEVSSASQPSAQRARGAVMTQTGSLK